MRAVLLCVVVCCAVAYGQIGAPGGFQNLDESKWGEVTAVLEGSLVKLASEQGHHLKLVKLRSVKSQTVAGVNYEADAVFENATGENLNCSLTLWVQSWTNFDKLTLKCAEKEYVVVRGAEAT